MTTNIERRFIPAAELRVSGDTSPTIEGYAALFNSDSEDLGGFIERIAPGAFTDAIPSSDIRALFNHNPDYVLGRVSAGTLAVEEDARGLKISNTPPDTQWARDLLVSMRRGDVSQMSFGFRVKTDKWEMRDGKMLRTIQKIAELFDVSPVTYPAYPDTTVATRSLEHFKAGESPPERLYARSLATRRLQLALTR